jgi:hypothetical protein
MSVSSQLMRPALYVTPRGRDSTPVRDELSLALGYLALVAVTVMASLGGASSLARPFYMLAGLGFAYIAKRRSPWLFVSATLWFWLCTPFVRRMLEWRGAYIPADLVLVTPNIMAMFVVPNILAGRGILARRGAGYAVTLAACVLYGLFVSFFQGKIMEGATGAADWVIPLLYLFYFICEADRIDEAATHIEAIVTLGLVVVIPYGIYQFFFMPAWDAQWMVESGMGSNGQPLPEVSRIFSTLGAPAILGIWCATCIVLLSYFRNALLLILAPFVFLVAVMAEVRAAWGSMILAILIGTAMGRGRFGGLILLVGMAGVVSLTAVTMVSPVLFDRISARMSTIEKLSDDGSLKARAGIWQDAPDVIDANPFGYGLGATHSLGTVGRSEASQPAETGGDAGPVAIYLSLGWLVGSIYLAAIILIVVHAFLIGKRNDSALGLTMAAAAVCPLGTLPFNNVYGFPAAIAWICIGYAIALDIKARSSLGRLAADLSPPETWPYRSRRSDVFLG